MSRCICGDAGCIECRPPMNKEEVEVVRLRAELAETVSADVVHRLLATIDADRKEAEIREDIVKVILKENSDYEERIKKLENRRGVGRDDDIVPPPPPKPTKRKGRKHRRLY